MIDISTLFSGVLLGVFFFGGLWWTVRKIKACYQPAFWILGSVVVRMSLTLVGLYHFSGHECARLLLCLIGFVMARYVVLWITERPADNHVYAGFGVRNAP